MSLVPGQRLGVHEVVARIGAGGMGEVYRATDTRLGRDVALKVLPDAFASDAERRARFEREARLLASLNHPNIAQVYGFESVGQAGGSDLHFLGMELVEGEDLAERLKRGPIPLDEAIAIAKQIAAALEEAHEKGVVHRDLKPANVKVTPDGRVKVLDFGLAKAWEGDVAGSAPDLSQSPTLAHHGTQAGIILGTAAYMSPEQARGKAVDKRADIWAFGVVLFEMLSRRQLFAGETVSDTLAAVLRQDIDWAALPAGTPEPVKHLLRRCLERDPKLRLRDIGDARLDLHDAAAPASQAEARGVASVRRWRAAVVVVAAAAGALLIGLVVGRWLSDGARERGPVRLLLEPPEGAAFHDVPVVSPDGRAVAFLARATAGSGRLGLFVRRLAGAAERLGGVEFSTLDIADTRPFWSPDSSALGFCDGQQLRVAPLNGGAVRALAPCDRSWRGGAWGESGVILFVPNSNSAVLAIPAAGGTARPASAFDANVPDLSHRYPRFLPGGQRFLYLAWSNAAGAAEQALGLFIGDLEKGQSRKLSDARGSVEYVGTGAGGRVLLRRDRSLVAVDLEPRTFELSGSETLVEPTVAFDGNTGYTFVSATVRGDIVVLSQQDTSLAMPQTLGWVDRRGTDQNAIKVPARYVDVALAPNGRMLAAEIADPARGVNDIWVIDLEREVASRLTQGRDHSYRPVWHPDGRRIGFSSEETGRSQPYVVMADRSAPSARLAETPHDDATAGFSADGEWLILERSDQRAEIWARSLRDGREVPLCQRGGGGCGEPAVSPDGRLLAYVADESGRHEVYVRPFMGEGAQIQVSAAGGRRPHWRSDSQELVYRDLEGWTTAVAISTGRELRAGTPQRLMVQAIDSFVVPASDHSRFLTRNRMTGGAAMARLVLDWK